MTQTTHAELAALMARPTEDNHLEFKAAQNQYDTTKLFKRCVAIANEFGGKLIMGVTDRPPRQIIGTAAFPNLAKIEADIFNKLKFRVVVEEVTPCHSDGRVLIFHIPPRPRGTAFQFEGQYLMRVGEETPVMSEDRLREIFNEGAPDWLDEVALDDCDAADVVRLLDTQTFFDLLKLPYPSDRQGVLERLSSQGLVVSVGQRWAIKNIGAILLAKSLAQFESLIFRAPRVIVYQDADKLSTVRDQPGDKGYAVGFEGLIDFINGLVPANEILTSAIREERQLFPKSAIRELVANALVHQDFVETGSSVRIELYSNRLEISNPGKPLISIDRFIDEYKSRNESLAKLMRRFGICEEKSSGIDRVVMLSELYQLPAPDFLVGSHHTTSVIFAPREFKDLDTEGRIRACYQHCCLRYVAREKMTNQSLRERFKLGSKQTETASRIIRDTVEAGKVKLTDPSVKSTRYRSYIPFWA
ncbi:ATP-binding protein [Neorhodopirellula lusitana]|uniref:ATP-binding protein n=1 Tax=Neorhodopirellula lusitana TaxID=445327 RepID=UPI00384FFCBE